MVANGFGVMRKRRRMSELEIKKGWYLGLASRFSDHYYVKIKIDEIRSRCGQINMKMLNGKSVTTLKLFDPKSNRNVCQSCKFLLTQDEEHKLLLEPYRY